MARVLVVDDDKDVRMSVGELLKAAGHEVICAADGAEAIQQLRVERADVAVMDVFMPEMDGFEAIAHFRTLRPGMPIIAMCGRPDADAMLQVAAAMGAAAVLHKPFSADELTAAVEKALKP